jgi:hypothetical protein
MMRCGSTYTLHELGDGPKFEKPYFATARAKCLDQVFLRCPKLPMGLDNCWTSHKWAFCKLCSEWWGVNTGTKFLQKVNLLIATLGVHYHGHADVKAKLTPQSVKWLKENQKQINDPRAFEDFARGLETWLPKSMMNLPTG